ncbi:hypothetical protein BOTNAR_0056g00260 [Botryotinia narcissicola]|uniref:SET domain-containing protein n=1 Tax=Botryotinia narcissicola TaxID=278944 RepID=A0A4Z1JCM8_9HELO|nr:hypothetical protein BOTNAR_0056g00260 [Botryotinia narcissicola]
MDATAPRTLPLAEASHFEEWFRIAMMWKTGKSYRCVSPAKEKRFDGSKGELVGLLTPPASPLKPKSTSFLDSPVSTRKSSITSSLVSPVSESSLLAPLCLTPPMVVTLPDSKSGIDSKSTLSRAADFPACSKSSPRILTPPSPPPEKAPLFENEFYEVRTSPKGGLGCFAKADIESGTMIHSEEPLFLSSMVQIYYNFEQLTAEKQAAYLKLHYWHGLAAHKVLAIFQTNRFHVPGGKSGIFLNSSRFNHACPGFCNCTYGFRKEINEMVFTTLSDITKGQEITISYANVPTNLYQNYGFFCDCPGCPPGSFASKKWEYENDLRRQAEKPIDNTTYFEPEPYIGNEVEAWESAMFEW